MADRDHTRHLAGTSNIASDRGTRLARQRRRSQTQMRHTRAFRRAERNQPRVRLGDQSALLQRRKGTVDQSKKRRPMRQMAPERRDPRIDT